MSKRRVTPEELLLWQKVATTADRLGPERKSDSLPLRQTEKQPAAGKIEIPRFETGQNSQPSLPQNDVLPGLPDRLAKQPLKMDKKTHARLKKGKVKPEARIDLHGMTMARAHPALIGFILSAHAQGKRLVLVITGKGKNTDDGGPIPVRHGVLKHAVPQWLSMPPLGTAVLQVTEANVRHGGGGAYYVYLRRQR
ncbi:MAG: Smr/MutS family protein [Pseudomonadota bacterium]